MNVYRIYDPFEKKFCSSGRNPYASNKRTIWMTLNGAKLALKNMESGLQKNLIIKEYTLQEHGAALPEPKPKKGSIHILDLVQQDLVDRAEAGKKKYGTYLEANNGRNALMDAYQEALDLCMYLRQAIEEQSD